MENQTTVTTSDYLSWTWGNKKYGTLTTIIQEDGIVQQGRHHPADTNPSLNPWGQIQPAAALQLIQQARTAIAGSPLATSQPSPFPPTGEYVEARVPAANGEQVCQVPVTELARHPEMVALREAVVAVRKQVSGGFFSWRSIGGRLAILLVLVIGAMTWWIIRDWRDTAAMEKSAERLDATVLTKVGKTGYDTEKHITVRFTPASGKSQEQKIAQYLSAENWDKANPGTTVRIWHAPTTGHTYLEDDIQRWNRDKKWIPILPIGIALPIIVICFFLSPYRVGVHNDGREYLVLKDYVAADDRNALIDRTNYNVGRLLWWLAK